MKTDVTYLGTIRRVIGAKVLVEIAREITSSPIIYGKSYRLGQIGSYIRIPLGFLNLYGIVSMVGASELMGNEDIEGVIPHGERWIEVQLVGESYGKEGFQRGISVFPTIDDEVHVVIDEDLNVIYGTSGPAMVNIGTHAASESLPANIDIDKIVTRHAAILGSTGSGKSNTVAGLLKALSSNSFPNARIVVIDPHGEYSAALQEQAQVFSITDQTNPLIVPYWALSFDELMWFFVGRSSANETIQDTAVREYIFTKKMEICSRLKAGHLNPEDITADSPIPFSIRELWYKFDREFRVTYTDMARTSEALETEGDAQILKSAKFKPPGAGSSAPFKPSIQSNMGQYVNKILGRLKDKRFDFLLKPSDYDGVTRDLDDLISSWINHEKSITVLDLGGIPFEISDLIVGVVARILFESMFWGRDMPGTGRDRPLLLVCEEAHSYLPRGGGGQFIVGYASHSIRRICKEGRKYGIGAIVVSQRPSELDETILSQCGTFFALRLSNGEDQGRVRSTVPDSLAGLIELLPALRTGEAIVLGDAVPIPSRIRLPLIEPRPKSDDPEPAKSWSSIRVANVAYDEVITAWRLQNIKPIIEGGTQNGENSG
ncbi:MAG: DUF87 domain-containing protein [Dehalococcoides mccartyi]|uniref:ATP-binding protein n=1 Tax=Dehalococcoides TaxID=61434 RepID=UPI002737CAF9|nr:DUF87 domain-containing protein [Dehalococcoides mccartyi]MDP4280181.1 DUF87 domain-containing protein [Dehalococcoides mccartyi]